MFTDGNGNFTLGDCPQFFRSATSEEILTYNNSKEFPAYKAKAQELLDASDIVILRCYERGVIVPIEWQTYRATLRVILASNSVDVSQPLPQKPIYPQGT